MILLDGEGIIFKDEYLQHGEEGGRTAAKQLEAGLRSYLSTSLSSINEPKLLARMYLDVKGLGEICARTGLITDAAAIHDFVRGFNETMSHSEIVDIGSGKTKAFDKIQGWWNTTWHWCIQTNRFFLQKLSKSSSTIVIATRSSWVARQIVTMDNSSRIRCKKAI